MGYEAKPDKKKSMNEMAGAEFVDRPGGGVWKIKVFTLSTLWRFHSALGDLMSDPCRSTWVRFFQVSLEDPEPHFWTTLRRAAGLPDFSARRIAREIPASKARELRDAVVRANLDMSFDDFLRRCEENVKKNSAPAGQGTGAE